MTATSPALVANALLAAGDFLTDDSGTVHRYTGTHWEPCSETKLQNLALEAEGYRQSVGKRRSEIIGQVKARSYRAGHKWGRVEDWEVPCRNVVVDVRTMTPRPHRKEDYLEKVIPWDWEPGALCPRWEQALLEWWPGDQREEPAALQDYFGYIVLPHARFKKALVLKGDSDSGKTVPLMVAMRMVGQDRTCALPAEKMADPIARAVIVGKQLNVMTEMAEDALVADDGFKQLVSTEEPIFVNEKYKPPYMYVPTAKHVFATNELPRVTDRTRAVIGRLHIVPFSRIFVGSEKDEALPAALVLEMPGILLWALEGARRLIGRGGQFAPLSSAEEVFRQLRADSNPVIDFLRERCIVHDGRALPLAHLVGVYNRWHKGSGRATVKGLGKMLRAADQVVKDVRYPKGAPRAEQVMVKCLIGFQLTGEREPAWLGVERGAAILGDEALEATDNGPLGNALEPL